MPRRLRMALLLLVPTLCVLLAAPSCSPMGKLVSRTGRSADELARPLDDVARQQEQTSETLVQRLTASEPAMEVIGKATEPAVQAACQILAGYAVPTASDPSVAAWYFKIKGAYDRGEPMKEACDLAGKLAGAAGG